jgi:hypothetical protein
MTAGMYSLNQLARNQWIIQKQETKYSLIETKIVTITLPFTECK